MTYVDFPTSEACRENPEILLKVLDHVRDHGWEHFTMDVVYSPEIIVSERSVRKPEGSIRKPKTGPWSACLYGHAQLALGMALGFTNVTTCNWRTSWHAVALRDSTLGAEYERLLAEYDERKASWFSVCDWLAWKIKGLGG